MLLALLFGVTRGFHVDWQGELLEHCSLDLIALDRTCSDHNIRNKRLSSTTPIE